MNDSDDSDFYGPPATAATLRHRASSFNPESWRKLRRNRRRHGKRRSANPGPTKSETPSLPHSHASPSISATLHNPYAGVSYAWQITESAEAFLNRLRPSTTAESDSLPCIYACNPLAKQTSSGIESFSVGHARTFKVPGAEHEAPLTDLRSAALLPHLINGGMERLHLASEFINGCRLRTQRRDVGFVARECRKAGADAARDILGLAAGMKLTGGKWMLFCSPDRVDDTWATVLRATVNNELGVAAKVTPRPPPPPKFKVSADAPLPGGAIPANRLICIYTADFGDIDDVRRVAERLNQLGILRAHGRALYYKPDVYTYLGISSGNPWDIKASLYDTTTVLGRNRNNH